MKYQYQEIMWMVQETADRWPLTTLYVMCWPMIMAIFVLTGGRL